MYECFGEVLAVLAPHRRRHNDNLFKFFGFHSEKIFHKTFVLYCAESQGHLIEQTVLQSQLLERVTKQKKTNRKPHKLYKYK